MNKVEAMLLVTLWLTFVVVIAWLRYRNLHRIKQTSKQKEATRSFKLSSAWLKHNSRLFEGEWVAVQAGVLLGHDKNRMTLQRSLAALDSLSGVLFFRIESPAVVMKEKSK